MGRWTSGAVLLAAIALVACESPAALGASCDRNAQCASPLVCRLARCRSECTENRDCPVGAECLRDDDGQHACSLPADRGCTSGGTACPTPLTCVSDHCVNTCSAMRDCPDDGECRAVVGTDLSFCFAPDRALDGGTVDGGTAEDAGVPPSDGGGPCADGACARSLCVGAHFACGLHPNGTVGCWGLDSVGQLGDGDDATTPSAHPADAGGVDAGVDFSSTAVTVMDDEGDPVVVHTLACTEQAACGILADGAIACWGGEGGSGTVLSGDPTRPTPARAHTSTTLGSGFTALYAGRYHYCATRGSSGATSVACWGDTDHGELGNGIHGGGSIETMLGDVWGGAQLALGDSVTCALTNGRVRCSGGDDDGALGPGATQFPADEGAPVDVPLGGDATHLVAGAGVECVLLESQSVACWGWGEQGSLGYAVVSGSASDDCAGGGPSPCHRAPLAVELGATPIAHLWSGGFTPFVCAQDGMGHTSCWGDLPSGDCGFVAAPARCATPVRVPVFDGAIEIAMGSHSTCARMADQSIRCVGSNELGALGRGTTSPSTSPEFDEASVIGF